MVRREPRWEDWEYEYKEPIPGENDKMKDTETRDRLLASREELVKQFESTTLAWIKNPTGEEAKTIKEKREAIAVQLRDGYWQLDPYVRSRSLYDRVGIIQPDGRADWDAVRRKATTNETSADDLD